MRLTFKWNWPYGQYSKFLFCIYFIRIQSGWKPHSPTFYENIYRRGSPRVSSWEPVLGILASTKNMLVGRFGYTKLPRGKWVYAWCPVIDWCSIQGIFPSHTQMIIVLEVTWIILGHISEIGQFIFQHMI